MDPSWPPPMVVRAECANENKVFLCSTHESLSSSFTIMKVPLNSRSFTSRSLVFSLHPCQGTYVEIWQTALSYPYKFLQVPSFKHYRIESGIIEQNKARCIPFGRIIPSLHIGRSSMYGVDNRSQSEQVNSLYIRYISSSRIYIYIFIFTTTSMLPNWL